MTIAPWAFYIIVAVLSASAVVNVILAFTLRSAQSDLERAEHYCAAAYQVIGCFLDHLGVHDSDKGQRLLDFFAGYKGAPDPLPFSVKSLLE